MMHPRICMQEAYRFFRFISSDVFEMIFKHISMRYILLSLFLLSTLLASAQKRNIVDELQKKEVEQGEVSIHQSPEIAALLGVIHEKGQNGEEPKMLKGRGYRIQVFAGNSSRVARDEANEIAEQLKMEYPELPVYTFFRSPRWLCRVGDYRSVEEADAAMRLLKSSGKFKEVSIVREQINIPLD